MSTEIKVKDTVYFARLGAVVEIKVTCRNEQHTKGRTNDGDILFESNDSIYADLMDAVKIAFPGSKEVQRMIREEQYEQWSRPRV